MLLDMFERFTSGTRHVVVLALEEGQRFKHDYVGTEHLLLAILRDPESGAHQAIRDAGVDVDRLRMNVERHLRPGSQAVKGEVPFTPEAKRALLTGEEECARTGCSYILPEHLLLGISATDGVASDALHEFVPHRRLQQILVEKARPAAATEHGSRRLFRRRAMKAE